MKKSKKFVTLILTVTLSTSMTATAFATEIPRASAPLNATEEQIVIVENIISDILDDVAVGNSGYTEAAGEANTRIRKSVIAGETNGYGYGILSPIAQNAILDIRDMYLRPDFYINNIERVQTIIAPVIEDYKSGKITYRYRCV